MGRVFVLICWLGALLTPAHASDDSPDVQAAKRHFASGTSLYNQGRYAEAIVEFKLAKQTHSAPAFDYNIARCLERLERWGDAADAYQVYLAAAPNTPERAEVTARIDVLRKRVSPADGAPRTATTTATTTTNTTTSVTTTPTATPTVPRRRTWIWGVVGGVGGALIVGGAIALGVVLGTAKDESHPIMGVRF